MSDLDEAIEFIQCEVDTSRHLEQWTENHILTVLEAATEYARIKPPGWQDISTAPKDEWILVWDGMDEAPEIVELIKGDKAALDTHNLDRLAARSGVTATHWQPLPPPPKIGKKT